MTIVPLGNFTVVAVLLIGFAQAIQQSNYQAKPLYISRHSFFGSNHKCLNTSRHPIQDGEDAICHGGGRRSFLKQAAFVVELCGITAAIASRPEPAMAGEIGARIITRAVTESELGLSVRRSVVRGAQIMDGVDGQWERFSDRFGLGAARQKQPGRPAPKVIPKSSRPLNAMVAAKLLNLADAAFVKSATTTTTTTTAFDLAKQVQRVRETVAPSFVRSGLTLEDVMDESDSSKAIMGAGRFNFLCYCHFKAYSDIIIEQNIDFRSFKNQFESLLGEQLVALLCDNGISISISISNTVPQDQQLEHKVKYAQRQIERLSVGLVERGLVAQVDASPAGAPGRDNNKEYDYQHDLADWLDGMLPDLQWTVALDGDITQNCQILLQEQGYRLYPNFARYAVQSILSTALQGQANFDITDYYLDTDYHSDPDKFEVKQVLLNIVLERL